ncbi:MAG: hypothetical protein ACOX05_01475 [Bacillota bacterium]|jgi:exopolyphosphatase/guanosine-5'-triphosphate,3'-diphosphate pyrophosphatase
MHYGIVDIGSNNVRLVIFNKKRHKVTAIFNETRAVGLIDALKEGKLSAQGRENLLEILDQYYNLAKVFKVKELGIFGTAPLRAAQNCDQLVKEVYENLGLSIDVLGSEREAYYAYLGVKKAGLIDGNLLTSAFLPGKNACIVDVGGGSSQIVKISKGKYAKSLILPLGSLSMRSKFIDSLLPRKENLQDLDAYVQEQLEKEFPAVFDPYKIFVGVGGTARILSRLDRHNKQKKAPTHGYEMSFGDLEKIYQATLADPEKVNNTISKICLTRVLTAVPGIILFYQIAKKLEIDNIVISRFGVREGYLYQHLLTEEEQEKCLFTVQK